MAQFDVYRTVFPEAPLVVQVQSDLLDDLVTRVVIPLRPANEAAPLTRLHPTVIVNGQAFTLVTTETATVLASTLTMPLQSLMATHRQDILDALDFLLHGF